MTIQDLAHELRDALAPGCERIEVAGSIRRGKRDPKDIELVAIARMHHTADMFGQEYVTDELEGYLSAHTRYIDSEWQFDTVLKRNGPKYKRLRHIVSGVCCDLFITTAEQWGVIFALRTGPGDFSKALVTRAYRYGLKVDEGQLWRTHRDDTRTPVPTPDEAAFFAALHVPYLEPEARSVEALER